LTYTSLDRGEAEVLALAVEHSARLVIMDERKCGNMPGGFAYP
jgi:predicted nucleic acid-binding protein